MDLLSAVSPREGRARQKVEVGNFTQVSRISARNLCNVAVKCLLPGTSDGSWIGSRSGRTQTSTLVWEIRYQGVDLPAVPQHLAPNIGSEGINKHHTDLKVLFYVLSTFLE